MLDQIKIGIRIVSLVVGAIIWGYICKFTLKTIVNALPDKDGHCKNLSVSDICKVVFSSLWIALHICAFITLVCWAWM